MKAIAQEIRHEANSALSCPLQIKGGPKQDRHAKPCPDDGETWWLSRLRGRIIVLLSCTARSFELCDGPGAGGVHRPCWRVISVGWAWWTSRISGRPSRRAGTLGEQASPYPIKIRGSMISLPQSRDGYLLAGWFHAAPLHSGAA